jgi:hypothetical protein
MHHVFSRAAASWAVEGTSPQAQHKMSDDMQILKS